MNNKELIVVQNKYVGDRRGFSVPYVVASNTPPEVYTPEIEETIYNKIRQEVSEEDKMDLTSSELSIHYFMASLCTKDQGNTAAIDSIVAATLSSNAQNMKVTIEK
jgi:hypothetical protein